MVRSIVLVIGAYVAMAVIVVLGTLSAAAVLEPASLQAFTERTAEYRPSAAYLTANLLVSFLGAAFGGWIVASLAPAAVRGHLLAFAAVILLLGLLSAFASGAAAGQPGWYPWVIPVVAIAGVAAAGAVTRRRAA